MTERTVLTVEEFETLADIHGGDLLAWPADVRAAAERLLAESEDAQRIFDEAAALDGLLSDDPALAPSASLTARVLADAAANSALSTRKPAQRRVGGSRFGDLWRDLFGELGAGAGAVLASACVVAVVSGLVTGGSTPGASRAIDGVEYAFLQEASEAVDATGEDDLEGLLFDDDAFL